MNVTKDDLTKLEPVLHSGSFQTPNIKISVYKNRRGSYKAIYLWCKADLGTCRVRPQFVTNWNYELQSIDNIKIIVEEEKGAF